MDHNGENDNEDFGFGIHLDDLIESEESPETGSIPETDNSPATDSTDEAPDGEADATETDGAKEPEA